MWYLLSYLSLNLDPLCAIASGTKGAENTGDRKSHYCIIITDESVTSDKLGMYQYNNFTPIWHNVTLSKIPPNPKH